MRTPEDCDPYEADAINLYMRHKEVDSMTGYVNLDDALFLHRTIRAQKPIAIAEIGTASGLSTAIIAHALQTCAAESSVTGKLFAYDKLHYYYADNSLEAGFFVSRFAPELLPFIEWRRGCTALDMHHDMQPRSLPLLFIDANHWHPWPSLDFIAALPSMHKEGIVLFHDINLPFVHPEFPQYGVHWLFNALPLKKQYSDVQNGSHPNIGSVQLLENIDLLRQAALKTIRDNPWERQVSKAYLEQAGLTDLLEESWKKNERLLGVPPISIKRLKRILRKTKHRLLG